MAWQGAGQDADGRAEQLPAGYHRVKIVDVKFTKDGDLIAVIGNRRGECAEFLTTDIAPLSREEREAYYNKTGRGHSGFRFWRLMGAADYPSADYWSAPTEERPSRTWDAETDLRTVMDIGTEFWVEIEEWTDKKGKVKAQLQTAKSLTRHAEVIAERDPGPGGSKIAPPKPVEAKKAGGGYDTEVPFSPGSWWR